MYNMIELKGRANGRWLEIVNAAGMNIKGIKNKHESCPLCPDDWPRFRMDNKDGAGSWICNHCGAGDGMELVKQHFGNFKEAADFVAGYLGMSEETEIDWAEINKRKEIQAKINAERIVLETERKLSVQAYAAEGARLIVSASIPAMSNHAYLLKKHITGGSALLMPEQFFIPTSKSRVDINGSLIIPMINERRELVNCQVIKPDGFKMFLLDGQVIGAFHLIGRPKKGELILLGEGFATMDTLRNATGLACVVAFNAGNLSAVCGIIKYLYPDNEIIITGDNDHHNNNKPVGNDGLKKAFACSTEHGVRFEIPPELKGVSDFNDLDVIHGRPALIAELIKLKLLTA